MFPYIRRNKIGLQFGVESLKRMLDLVESVRGTLHVIAERDTLVWV